MTARTTVIHFRDRRRGHPDDVYIGRAGRGEIGTFGNPFRAGRKCRLCGEIHKTGEDTLPCFRKYFITRLCTDKAFVEQVEQLRGKRLVCFCKPKPCHGDIIKQFLDWSEEP